MEGVKAVSVAQGPLVKKLCLEGFVCPSGQAWGMPMSLSCPALQYQSIKSGQEW